jgi:alpha-L-rhamnosidase
MLKQILLLSGCAAATFGTISGATAALDPRGPVANAHMEVAVSPEGVEAGGYAFRNAPPRNPLTAQWIWLDDTAARPVAAYFRREVSLAAAPRTVIARVSADRVYRLWVNGRLVARGPADPGNDIEPRENWSHRWLYDVYDLTPFFHVGTNVIAAEVFTSAHPNFSLGSPGFFFDAIVTRPDRTTTAILSGPEWSAIAAEAWPVAPAAGKPPARHLRFEAAREPEGWRNAPFAAAQQWPAAREIPSIWENLSASEIPPRMEAVYPPQKGAAPVTLSGDGKFTVAYDRVLSAYIGFGVRGPAGAVISVEPNERKQPGFHRRTEFVLREGVTYYEFPVMDSFSILNIAVTGATAPVVFEDIRASFVSYPVSYRGSFESSDAALNKLWKALRWGTQLCMQTHHLDSPHHQEPISDPGDYLIEAQENYYAFGERWLARQDLRKFGLILAHNRNLNFHTSYSLLWLQMLVDYYDYTGDAALVKELAPTVHSLLDTFAGWRGRHGLISEAPSYMFMDWVEMAGFSMHHPPAAIGQGYLTAFYYRALGDARRVAEVAGDTARIAQYGRLRTATAAAFQRELWSAERGLYRDGRPFQTSVAPNKWLPADREVETFSPQVNTLAVLYGLAPAAARRAVMEKTLAQAPLNMQPYFMHFLFPALESAGLFEARAVELMRRWEIEPETATVREMWKSGDYSHGWGGTPLIQMSSRILGVTPAAPGYAKISIRPQPCGLAWARGIVPTPRGDVFVEWRRAAGKFSLHVMVPAGATADVWLPGRTAPIAVGAGEHKW